MRILVVDDSEVIRNMLVEVLTEAGHDVECATDGLEGIELATRSKFDLVICDTHMPGKNGFQVLTSVRAAHPSTNFLMTDSLPDKLAEQALKGGALGCLAKPFDLKEVLDLVGRISFDRQQV